MTAPSKNPEHVAADLAAFIRSADFPCVGGKSALAQNRLYVFEAGAMTEPHNDLALRQKLFEFANLRGTKLTSFACVFAPAPVMTELQFEDLLWRRLQALHDLDAMVGVGWDEDVSSDPASPHFSMSIAGAAFFVVGLHPGASRRARRFWRPTMIFNLHEQFRRVAAAGHYARMQEVVRNRDIKSNGDVNPMLADFGDASEAPQYSGRRVGGDWRCPLRIKI